MNEKLELLKNLQNIKPVADKITEEELNMIVIKVLRDDVSMASIARIYGVTQATIYNMVTRFVFKKLKPHYQEIEKYFKE